MSKKFSKGLVLICFKRLTKPSYNVIYQKKLFSERATSSGLSTVEGFQKCISIVEESIKVAERKKRAIQLTLANSPMNKSSTAVDTSK